MKEKKFKTFSCRKAERTIIAYDRNRRRVDLLRDRRRREFQKAWATPDVPLGELAVARRAVRDIDARIARLEAEGGRLREAAAGAARKWRGEGTFEDWSQLGPIVGDIGRAAEGMEKRL